MTFHWASLSSTPPFICLEVSWLLRVPLSPRMSTSPTLWPPPQCNPGHTDKATTEMLLAISPAYDLWSWQIISPLVSLMKHHPLASLLVSQNRSIPPHSLLQFLYSFLYHLPGQIRHFHFIYVSHCLTQPSKSHPSSEFSPFSNNFVKVLYPIYQESTLKSVNSFLSSLTFQPLDQAQSKSNSRGVILALANIC